MARPKSNTPNREIKSFRIIPSLWGRLIELANKTGRTVSATIEAAVSEYLDRMEKKTKNRE